MWVAVPVLQVKKVTANVIPYGKYIQALLHDNRYTVELPYMATPTLHQPRPSEIQPKEGSS